jgi:hypothetical protein
MSHPVRFRPSDVMILQGGPSKIEKADRFGSGAR